MMILETLLQGGLYSFLWTTVWFLIVLTVLVFVQLPTPGRQLKAGEASAVVESVKTASDIYSPVSGEVVEANKAIVDDPAIVNTDPYGAGWFFKIKFSQPEELSGLLSAADYRQQIGL